MKVAEIKEKFILFLKRKGHRVTAERLNILENILKANGHIDADELFLQMRKKGIKASRATVYNTLQILLESGIISKSSLGESHQHYERAFGLPQHYHLVCVMCGSVIEFQDKSITNCYNQICGKYNFKSNSILFQITGICNKCSKKS